MGYRLSSAAWPDKIRRGAREEFHGHHFRQSRHRTKRQAAHRLRSRQYGARRRWPSRRDRHRKHLRARLLDGRRHRPGVHKAISGSRGRTDPLRHHVRRSTRDLCGSLCCACHARSGWIVGGADRADGSGRSPTHRAISGKTVRSAEDQMRRETALAYAVACCGPAISGICRVRRLEGAFPNPMPYARPDRRSRPADPA